MIIGRRLDAVQGRSYPAIGETFGRWTVIAAAPDRKTPNSHVVRFIRCRCECGAEREVRIHALWDGSSKSCGDPAHRRSFIHGMSRTPTYIVWSRMHGRCKGDDEESTRLYLDRGITVCERWSGPGGFENFLADVGKKPPGRRISIDRIDNDGNYEPSNCRWATPKTQNGNTRNNVWVNYAGQRMILEDACRALGMKQATVTNRANRHGITQQQALDHYAFGWARR